MDSKGERASERRYLKRVLTVYARANSLSKGSRSMAGMDLEQFHRKLFTLQVEHYLGATIDRIPLKRLIDIRLSTERARLTLEEWFVRGGLKPAAFARAFDTETILFQDAVANLLSETQYEALFGTSRDRRVVLSDKRIVSRTQLKR
jgi:hypothetical protein